MKLFLMCGSWLLLGVFITPRFFPSKLDQEVKSLRDDLNQLTVIVSELDTPIIVKGEVADEHFGMCFTTYQ